jgi:uroporphyrinogen III methyltransferase/synthase
MSAERNPAPPKPLGRVYLVGAGPGDPDLITVKGRRILERADVILFDHLAAERLLSTAPAHAERIYVGKKRADHEFQQEEITAMLVQHALAGKQVVRLKGGDPFIFGRGGEEVEALVDAGIPYEIVPGVTTPLGLAAYTGVPLTHREHTSAVTFVTGHNVDAIDWSRLGASKTASETIVLFMGLMNFAAIAQELIQHGRSADTPAMAVRWATRPDQRTIVGTLGTLPHLLEQAGMRPPATIVIGEVVSLRDRFNWFERLPLFGQKIVITRDARQSSQLAEPFEALGAETIFVPVIEIAPPGDPAPLREAIRNLASYDWLIFTSANAVRAFVEALDEVARTSGADLRSLRAKICAIGPATKAAVEALHVRVDVMPKEYVAESLLDALKDVDLKGQRVLLPRAAVARDVVPKTLRDRGAMVDVVEAYRTVQPAAAEHLADDLRRRQPDWGTFTSSSTVKNFIAALGNGDESAGREAAHRLQTAGMKVASIGPITSATARQFGLRVDVEADPHTIPGLVAAISQAAAQNHS